MDECIDFADVDSSLPLDKEELNRFVGGFVSLGLGFYFLRPRQVDAFSQAPEAGTEAPRSFNPNIMGD